MYFQGVKVINGCLLIGKISRVCPSLLQGKAWGESSSDNLCYSIECGGPDQFLTL